MRFLTALLLLLLAVSAAPAAASMGQESIFEDNNVLLERGAERQASGLTEMAALGADTVRSIVYWRDVVPTKKPKGFKPASMASYPAALWDRYDDLVRGADLRGLNVLLTPSSPAPLWASRCTGGATVRKSCRPDPKLYAGFVRVLGQRYSGSYADENQGGGVLPRVDRWSFWNEPNIPGWLRPQYARKRGVVVVDAAVQYRKLAAGGIASLRATGHGSDTLLLGETAPVGRTTGKLDIRPSSPTAFINTLFCVDARGRSLRGRARVVSGCSKKTRLRVNGFAHHPYTRGGHDPPYARPAPGQISFDRISRLKTLLSRGSRAGIVPRNLPIWLTEFGYQSNPPDPILGVPLAKQAEYINQADYLASRDVRIKAVSQYKLVDDQDQAAFQTGLLRRSLVKKPAYAAYQLPIWVVRKGSRVQVYGQVRPAANGTPQTVELQHAPRAGGAFTPVKTLNVTSATGSFLDRRTAYKPGVWRLRWTGPDGVTHTSRTATAGKR